MLSFVCKCVTIITGVILLKPKTQPIMVSTYEAWLKALDSGWDAIYIEGTIIDDKIHQQMVFWGYQLSNWHCRRGVLFTKPHVEDIYDSAGIL